MARDYTDEKKLIEKLQGMANRDKGIIENYHRKKIGSRRSIIENYRKKRESRWRPESLANTAPEVREAMEAMARDRELKESEAYKEYIRLLGEDIKDFEKNIAIVNKIIQGDSNDSIKEEDVKSLEDLRNSILKISPASTTAVLIGTTVAKLRNKDNTQEIKVTKDKPM